MSLKKIGKILGKIMILEGILMILPLIVSIVYQEYNNNIKYLLAFIIPIVLLLGIGILLQRLKQERTTLYQKEGFVIVALVWVIMAAFGALPFVINGDIPNYINALFETMSGFTTTGASVVPDVTKLCHSSLFWRSFTHWIGGMGILVFILIFIPESNDGSSLHLLKAESPGPQVGKITSKMKVTTRILYLIYLGMTIIEFVILCLDKPIAGYESDHIFNSMLASFGSAGTGGFGFVPGSMELYSPFSQYVISIFLILFGVNFSLYYLILIGKIKDVLKSEELKTYFGLIISSIVIIMLSIVFKFVEIGKAINIEEIFRHSLFQVASIITTTGYTSTDYNLWPELAKTVIIVLMFTGAMAGSTAGGIKASRIVISFKGVFRNIRKLINPRYVPKTKFEGKTLEEVTINDVFSFITLYFTIFVLVLVILAFDPVNGKKIKIQYSDNFEIVEPVHIDNIDEKNTDVLTDELFKDGIILDQDGNYYVEHGFLSNFSGALSCLSNIGPGLEAVGPYSNFNHYSYFSKITLTLTMMMGRLEILPVLILFSPKTWRKD